jgi:hypothetical protein
MLRKRIFVVVLMLCFSGAAWADFLDAGQITVTAADAIVSYAQPINLINGSGLQSDLTVNNNATDLYGWLNRSDYGQWLWDVPSPPQPNYSPAGLVSDGWVAFTFNTPQAINKMWVWNYNSSTDPNRDWITVAIDYTTDGTTWTRLGGSGYYFTFARSPGASGYVCNNKIDFGGIIVKEVVLSLASNGNYGAGGGYSGLSEVRFDAVPNTAALPSPESGPSYNISYATTGAVLSWTAGSFAAKHDVYFGTNQTAVTTATRANPQGVLVSQGQTGTTYDPMLIAGTTYYWRIDETNSDGSIIWPGTVWNFKAFTANLATDGTFANLNDISVMGAVQKAEWADPTFAPVYKLMNSSGFNGNTLMAENNSSDAKGFMERADYGQWLWDVPSPPQPNYSPSGLVGDSWVEFTFRAPKQIGEMWVWNYNSSTNPNYDWKTVAIDYTTDGTTWARLGGSGYWFTFAAAPHADGYICNNKINFGNISVKKVVLTLAINGNYAQGSGLNGLSEVRFKTTYPEPSPSKGTLLAYTMVNGALSRPEITDPVITGCDADIDGGYPDKPVAYIFDNNPTTEYASAHHGTNTYINFDFGTPTVMGGFMHRHAGYTDARATAVDLIFSNDADFSTPIATVVWDPIPGPGGLNEDIANGMYATHSIAFTPVTARYVKWKVTKLAHPTGDFPGAAEMAFYGEPNEASYTAPVNGSYAEPNAILTWVRGKNAVTHDVYFGTSQTAVTSATRANQQGVLVSQGQTASTYTPTLQPGTVYYWRIDEVKAGSLITKGSVWSFETYAQGALRELPDPIITGYAAPRDGVLVFDNNYRTQYKTAYLGVATYIDFDFGQVTAVAGFRHVQVDGTAAIVTRSNLIFSNVKGDFNTPIATIALNHGLTGLDQGAASATAITGFAPVNAKYVRWQVTGTSDDTSVGASEMAFMGFPAEAYYPTPANNAVDVNPAATLNWLAGQNAALHDVYFGTSQTAVTNATRANQQGVLVSQGQAGTTYAPTLQRGTKYYWRIDEVKADSSIKTGGVWNFTVRTYSSVDDFEYGSPSAFNSVWTPNGATSSLETVVTHASWGAMKLNYNFTTGGHTEVTRNTGFSDWTANSVKSLILYFHGRVQNGAENLYVRLNSTSANATVNYTIPANLINPDWIEWNIDLRQFTGVNLSDVKTITLGVSDLGSNGGLGTVYFDDIRLYPTRCVSSLALPNGDFNGDCAIDLKDFAMLAQQWLVAGLQASTVLPAQSHLLGWWKFNDGSGTNAADSSGKGNPGYIDSATWVNDSVRGWCLDFASSAGSYVDIPGSALSSLNKQVTIALWQYGDPVIQPHGGCIFEADDSSVRPVFICQQYPEAPGVMYWDAGGEAYVNGGERIFTEARPASDYKGKWNHWVFIKNVDTLSMQIWLNGILVRQANGADPVWSGFYPGDGTKTIQGIANFTIGADYNVYNPYDGMISDFRVYDYALSRNEIMAVMMNGTGSIPFTSEIAVFDLYGDIAINFKDLAVVASNWLKSQLFPSP